MQHKTIKLLHKIIMSFIALFVILQPSYVFSKTHIHYNTLTFRKQFFTMSKRERSTWMGDGAFAGSWGEGLMTGILTRADKSYTSNMKVSFTENERCVTHNQPYAGVTFRNNTISVKSGRKGSKDTAKCFINWFKDGGATSFNHNPVKLNFAVKGTLIVTIPTSRKTKNNQNPGTKTFTFYNMVFAQGRAGASNNWWVGGVNCTARRQGVISCSPEGYEKDKIAICFNRPYGKTGTIDLVSCKRKF